MFIFMNMSSVLHYPLSSILNPLFSVLYFLSSILCPLSSVRRFSPDVSERTDATRASLPSRDGHEAAERSRPQQHATRPAWTEPDAAPVWTAERCPPRPAATATAGAQPAATRREEEQYISGTRGA